MFGFQRLDAYKVAAQFLAESVLLAELVPKGYAPLGDQLRRAALSIQLNIAEGTGRFGRDQQRFYTIARGSALECAAIVDALEALGALPHLLARGRDHLERIVAMLTVLVRKSDS